MWELDCEEGWAPKDWCFWTVVLEKTLESPLDCKEIQPVHSEGDQSNLKDFFGRNDAKAETPVLWPPHAKGWLIGKDFDGGRDWGQEKKGMTEDEMAKWHHWLDGRESVWTLGVGDGQVGLACCDSWGTQRVGHDWATELNWTDPTAAECTFISSAHETYTRLDYILSHKTNLCKLKRILTIESIFSDYIGIKLESNSRKIRGKSSATWSKHYSK